MNVRTDDPILGRLADANPTPATPLSPAEAGRAEATLHRIVTTSPTAAAITSSRRGWRMRIVAGTTAVAAIIAGGVLGTAPASAEDVLLEAASNAAAQPVATGEYWYVRSEVDEPGADPFEREVWRSRDTYLLKSEESAAIAAAEDGDTSLDPSLVRVTDLSDSVEGGGLPGFGENPQFAWDELEALPTEPAELSKRLIAGLPATGHGDDWDLWTQTVSLLQESPARPELRRALWEVLAGITGVELLGRTTDSVGRDATAIRADFSDRNLGGSELLLDPGDGTLLETRITDNDGTISYGLTVLVQGPRDTAPAPDLAICGPGSAPEMPC